MKRIDDIIFNKFVCNTLSQSDMVEVEKQLIESKEISAGCRNGAGNSPYR